jgi:hypothetical protein
MFDRCAGCRRDPVVRRTRRGVHEHRALQQGPPGVRDRR